MILDDGIMSVYEVVSKRVDGANQERLQLKFQAWYRELGTGTVEWNALAQRGKTPMGRVRIWENRSAVTGDVIIFPDGRQCRAGRVYHGNEGDKTPSRDIGRNTGAPITEITLEKPDKKYDVPEVEA